MNAKDIIQNLHLLSHPEGGFYKETYRSFATLFKDTEIVEISAQLFTIYWKTLTITEPIKCIIC